jgi:hypothetical protein
VITFTLEQKEAEFIIQAIGQLPTQSGAFPLFEKLKQQYLQLPEVKHELA